MHSLKSLLNMSVARKLINWATGIGLVVFVIGHLVGNLTIFAGDGGKAFNAYAATLHSLGPLFLLIEIGLLLLFAFHIGSGLNMWVNNRKARKHKYAGGHNSKGGPSHFNLASTKMALSGIVIAAFVIVHVAQFRFGVFTSDPAKYATEPGGVNPHLFGLVSDTFANVGWVVFYCAGVAFLGWHLRHGIWSMLHSVGSMNRNGGRTSYLVAGLVGALLALGFFVLPIYMFLTQQ